MIDPLLNDLYLRSNAPSVYLISEENTIRVFSSKCKTLIILAIREHINYEDDFDILDFIVNFVLENRIKMIMQDFSGADITYYYLKLIKKYGKKRMLQNVVFDITQTFDGNCFPDVETHVPTDSNGNFIQSKYNEINSENIKYIYWSMIGNLAYMIRNPDKHHYVSIKISVAFVIYDIIDFDFEFNIQQISKLFHIIITEILRVKEKSNMREEIVHGLLSNDEKIRTTIINKYAGLIMK